jgi:hypothetical protein
LLGRARRIGGQAHRRGSEHDDARMQQQRHEDKYRRQQATTDPARQLQVPLLDHELSGGARARPTLRVEQESYVGVR